MRHALSTLTLVALLPAAVHAQFQIDWYTIDAGGGASSGGAFLLTGTIGQPDAGASAGGTFECGGGFWGTPPSGIACYPNCDGSSGTPLLTPNDFQCFLNAYASNLSYANCDSTGGLTPNDFQCFLNSFAAGCS
jgi:hypothetical protein